MTHLNRVPAPHPRIHPTPKSQPKIGFGPLLEKETLLTLRTGKALIQATRPYAEDDRARSMFHVVTTFVILTGLIAVSAMAFPWPVRLATSIVAGMVTVRTFILYHDYLHHAILRKSRAADLIFKFFGLLVLVPSRVWKQTHNHHHTHNARLHGSHIGSFEVMTTQAWHRASFGRKLSYRMSRSALTIALGYLTVFGFGMCVCSLLRSPRRNWDSAVALVLHVALVVTTTILFGPAMTLFTIIIPITVACAMGSYLFYVQHNFEGVKYLARDEWTYAEAALESSSYLKTNRVMEWFSGNIGYHHVHHLNPLVPFYRLPEAMDGIPELQDPMTATLTPRAIYRSFRLNLWDTAKGRMVAYSESKVAPAPIPAETSSESTASEATEPLAGHSEAPAAKSPAAESPKHGVPVATR